MIPTIIETTNEVLDGIEKTGKIENSILEV